MWSLLPMASSCLFLSASSLLSNGADYRRTEEEETTTMRETILEGIWQVEKS